MRDSSEVNPPLDVPTGIASCLAAHAAIELLGRICDQPRRKATRDARAAKQATVAKRSR